MIKIEDDGKNALVLLLPLLSMFGLIAVLMLLIRTAGNW
jgi:hypothetical protein